MLKEHAIIMKARYYKKYNKYWGKKKILMQFSHKLSHLRHLEVAACHRVIKGP